MDLQDRLLSMIDNENIIEAISIPPGSSIDQILNGRDTEEFSRRWLTCFNLIESRKQGIDERQSELSTQIREAAYLRTYALWKSPDLAAYVSDDFGLIADAAALGIDEPWINAILHSYRNGIIPILP